MILHLFTGGKGELSYELLNLSGIPSTVVDPRPLKLEKYRRRMRYGLYTRNVVLNEYNQAASEYVLGSGGKSPSHLRVCFEMWNALQYQGLSSKDVYIHVDARNKALPSGQTIFCTDFEENQHKRQDVHDHEDAKYKDQPAWDKDSCHGGEMQSLKNYSVQEIENKECGDGTECAHLLWKGVDLCDGEKSKSLREESDCKVGKMANCEGSHHAHLPLGELRVRQIANKNSGDQIVAEERSEEARENGRHLSDLKGENIHGEVDGAGMGEEGAGQGRVWRHATALLSEKHWKAARDYADSCVWDKKGLHECEEKESSDDEDER